MSVLAELLDRAHFALVCRKAARRLERRLVAAAAPKGRARQVQRSGIIVAEDLLVAPLSGARVAGYRVLVEIPAYYWMNRRVVVDHGALAPCVVRDAAGVQRVAGGRSLVVVAEPCQRGARAAGSVDEPHGFPAEVATVLAERAQVRAEGTDPHRYLWGEYHVHDGDHVLVDGVVGGDPDLLGADDGQPLVVSTIAKDALLAMLRDPDEAAMRRLPAILRSDRTLDE